MASTGVLLVDIDGTITGPGNHRSGELIAHSIPYGAARSVLERARARGMAIIYLTGRSEKTSQLTMAWLHQHGFPEPNRVIFYPPHVKWSWDSYLTYKKNVIDEVAARACFSWLLVIDDSHAVLKAAKTKGHATFHVTSEPDWYLLSMFL